MCLKQKIPGDVTLEPVFQPSSLFVSMKGLTVLSLEYVEQTTATFVSLKQTCYFSGFVYPLFGPHAALLPMRRSAMQSALRQKMCIFRFLCFIPCMQHSIIQSAVWHRVGFYPFLFTPWTELSDHHIKGSVSNSGCVWCNHWILLMVCPSLLQLELSSAIDTAVVWRLTISVIT